MARFLLAFPVALLACYGLMGLMALMVNLNTKDLKPESAPLQFSIFASEKKQSSQKKNRTLPKPPQMQLQPLMPKQPKLKPQSIASSQALEKLPDVKMDLAVSGININMPETVSVSSSQPTAIAPEIPAVQSGQSQEIMPLYRRDPVYPRRALQRNIEGYVLLTFDIGGSGRPENIKVTDAQPARIFNRAAIQALKSWKYQPMLINGKAQIRYGQQVKLEFRITKQ